MPEAPPRVASDALRTYCCGQPVADPAEPPECSCEPHQCLRCLRWFPSSARRKIHRTVGCDVDAEDGFHGPVLRLRNYVTTTWMSLSPPYTAGWDELLAFLPRFEAWCWASWELAHLDPLELRAPFGWEKPFHLDADAVAAVEVAADA